VGMPYFGNSAPTGCRVPGETGKLTGRQAEQRGLRGTGQREGL